MRSALPGAPAALSITTGRGRLGHDVPECLKPIQFGHLDVQRHDVGFECVDLPQRVESVASRADDAELL